MTVRQARPSTAHQYVFDCIKDAIVGGDLAPGTAVRQEALAEELGVSRVPLREAMRLLEADGHLRYAPNRGYVVAGLTADDVDEVYRARELLEPELIVSAVPCLNADVVARMDRARVDFLEATRSLDIVAMTAANRGLHFTLLEPANRPRILGMVKKLWEATDPYRFAYYEEEDTRRKVSDVHSALIDAAGRLDTDAIVDIFAANRRHAADCLRSFVS